MKWFVMGWAFLISASFCGEMGLAQDAAKRKATDTAAPVAGPGIGGPLRSKSIDFEGEVVEGLNKNPMDALEHTATRDKGDKGHLYRKKEHFRPEMKQLVRDMGFKR